MKNQINNQMQIFEHKDFGKIRTVSIDGEPWFVGKDVANVLGYSNASKAVSAHVDGEDRKMHMIPTAQNGKLVSKTYLINESGLYSLILSSKLQQAKAFKRWVTSEVLPTIRKYGAYITSNTLEDIIRNPEFTASLIQKLVEERDKNTRLEEQNAELEEQYEELESLNAELEDICLELESENEELAPKANYCDVILQCHSVVCVSQIAKDYGMSAVAFNKLLHRLGIQYKMRGTWLLYQKYAKQGYTQSHTYEVSDYICELHTYWTQKGRLFLYETLRENGILPMIERNQQLDLTGGKHDTKYQ